MIVSGIVVIVVSVLGGTIGTAMLGSGIGFSQFERDVAFDGPGDRLVPGTLSFSVLEPLDESNADMTVGVALSDDSTPEPDCALADVDGAAVALQPAAYDEQLLDMNSRYPGYDVISIARLEPGEYELSCESATEPSASSGLSFTVGRVIGVEDVTSMLGPLAWMLVVWSVAGLAFLVGLVLLIVGLVRRSRANRPLPQGPYGPGPFNHTPYGPGGYGPGGYGSGGYGQPPYGPGGYGPGGYGQNPVPPAGPPPAPPHHTPPPYEPPRYEPPAAPGSTTPDAPAPSSPEGSVGGWTIPPSKQQ